MDNDNLGQAKTKRMRRIRSRKKYKTSLGSFFGPICEKSFLIFFYIFETFDVLVRFCEPFLYDLYADSPDIYRFIVIEVEYIHHSLRFFPEVAFLILYVIIIRDKLELVPRKIYNNYFIQYYALHHLTLEIEKNFLYGLYKRICVYPNASYCKYIAGYCIIMQILFYLDCILCILIDRYVHIQFVTDSVFVQIGDKRKNLT